MDLAGPKLRTGPVESVAKVIKWHPRRDEHGRVLHPARIWLTPVEKIETAPETGRRIVATTSSLD